MTRLARNRRRGSLIPLLAVSAISLFAFVALAVDLGMMAVSRTHCQNAADASALSGCRTLNNKPGSVNSDLAKAVKVSKDTVSGGSGIAGNYHLAAAFTSGQIQKVETGQYLYDPAAGRFRVATWYDVTSSQSVAPATGSWTAIRVSLSTTQPTYFMRVFGVTAMPMTSTATAVYRPRDIAFVLDMTGSMAYASTFNYNGVSLNPDTLVPAFGHYGLVNSNLVATANQANSDGEAISMNNFTITTSGGPPIVRNFYFDPANASDPTASAYPVTSNTASLLNAFHRWSPPESGGDATASPPVGVTYDFTGYNAFHNGTESNPKGPTPAPYNFATMTDSTGITYVGDRYRRADGSVNKTDTTWTGANKAATTAAELLGYGVSGTNVYKSGTTGLLTTADKFRDPVWEAYGYDLKLDGTTGYRYWKTNTNNGNPGTAAQFNTKLAAGTAGTGLDTDRFKGYSMGPGYWGKTFYVWPPDPRWGGGTGNPDPTSPATPDMNDPAPKDTNGNYICDWRQRFFLTSTGAAWGSTANIDASLFRTSGNGVPLAASGYTVNYAAVLKWIKSGPQALPPNLRAGRVLYYSSIPDDVNTGTGGAQVKLDKLFWKNYIDYVLGYGYTSAGYLYGRGDSWAGGSTSVYSGGLGRWAGPDGSWPYAKPYMRYADGPNRPRLHLWFGPLSMLDFLTSQASNWRPGPCPEAQCWQLKAAMNAVIDDVRNNHPNDYVGLVMFASSAYNGIRRPMGQKYASLKNALFYPRSLLDAIDAGDVSSEVRPYDLSFNSVAGDEIPNASGQTDPNTGLAYAFNLLSPSSQLASATYGTVKGRRGAAKVVIFETDGVPNSYRGLSSATRTMDPTLRGYDTYYPDSGWVGFANNGDAASMSEAIKVVRQIAKPAAAAADPGTDSGLSLPNAPARVYPVAFGDLFDPAASPDATFRPAALQFLADVAAAGNTGTAGASTIPGNQIITGSYDQRITRLRDCMQRIFQTGVAVVLIE
jgi:hypothetical protein